MLFCLLKDKKYLVLRHYSETSNDDISEPVNQVETLVSKRRFKVEGSALFASALAFLSSNYTSH
jgi:hypothetical protein